MKKIFLHGLESSGNGTKGRFLQDNFTDVTAPDFSGNLEARLEQLEQLCRDSDELVLVGSSFGGLMATCFAIAHPERVRRLVLMAPALNFPGFRVPKSKITAPTYLLIGTKDIVTPAAQVIPLAEETFAELEIHCVDEDHLLHTSFVTLDWQALLCPAD